MNLRRLTLVCLLTILAVCGIALTPNEAVSRFMVGTGIAPVAPASIISITPNPPTGTLASGLETFTVCYGIPVTISGSGAPTLPLATSPTGSSAVYTSGSGTPCHVYDYTVTSGVTANPVATTASGIVANGAVFTDANGNTPSNAGAQSVAFPGLAFGPGGGSGAFVTSVTSSCAGTKSAIGTRCVLQVNFNTNVFIGGSWHPKLNLATTPVPGIAYLCGDADTVRTLAGYAQSCNGLGNGNGTTTLNFGFTLYGGQSASTVALSSAAFNLNGSTIQNSAGVAATLTGANLAVIAGLSFAPGSALCIAASGGNDSSSGLCGSASLATLTRAQSLAQSGSVKTIWLQNGTYTGLSTTSFQANGSVNVSTTYIQLTGSDNGEVWAEFPGQNAIIDGGASNNTNGVGVAFASNNGFNGITIQGINFAHFSSGGAIYAWSPVNLNVSDISCQNLYNQGAGAGGCVSVYNFWTAVSVRNITTANLQGFAVKFTGAEQSGLNGFAMTKTIDNISASNSCTVVDDCSPIYGGWFPNGTLAGLFHVSQITENFINGVGTANSQGTGVYLDDADSGEDVVGNIIAGIYTYGIQLHNGQDNDLKNNVIDLTLVSPHGSLNDTAYYMPIANCSVSGSCPHAANNSIEDNIVYNAYGGGPPAWMGLYQGGPTLVPPSLGLNWYFTAAGSFQNPPFGWAAGTFGSGSSGIFNPAGVLLGSQPFVNPGTVTPSGYLLMASAAPLSGGFQQITPTMGQR